MASKFKILLFTFVSVVGKIATGIALRNDFVSIKLLVSLTPSSVNLSFQFEEYEIQLFNFARTQPITMQTKMNILPIEKVAVSAIHIPIQMTSDRYANNRDVKQHHTSGQLHSIEFVEYIQLC